MNPGAVSAGKVLFAAKKKQDNEVVGEEDSLTVVVRKQEAALKKLEQKHGAGYGKPPPGSKSEARAKRYPTHWVLPNPCFGLRKKIVVIAKCVLILTLVF